MEISIKGFIYHKSAEKYTDCFDRYGINEKTNKFAISDGVSKSFFPDLWAELLVDFFINAEGHINIGDIDSYKSIQNEWNKRVGEIVNRPNQKYFVRNFFVQGRPAAATFVGLYFFKESGILKWEAIALGDSFLFFIPDQLENISDNFMDVLYLSSKDDFEFNNFPDFFDSRSIHNKGKIKQKRKELKKGTFYLMTDAMAEWFIAEKTKAHEIISGWETQNDFEKSIIELRKTTLHNDDSTILIIRVEEDNSSEIFYKEVRITNLQDLINTEKEKLKIHKSESEIVQSSLWDEDRSKKELEKETNQEQKSLNISNVQEKDHPEISVNDTKDSKEIRDNLSHTANINKIEKRKIGFWERLSYPFWGYWNSTGETEKEDLLAIKKEIDDKQKEMKPIDQHESKDEETSGTNRNIHENLNQNVIKEEEVDKKRNNKKDKRKKNSKQSNNSNDDISHITDKF
jgi:hypothetical protein